MLDSLHLPSRREGEEGEKGNWIWGQGTLWEMLALNIFWDLALNIFCQIPVRQWVESGIQKCLQVRQEKKCYDVLVNIVLNQLADWIQLLITAFCTLHHQPTCPYRVTCKSNQTIQLLSQCLHLDVNRPHPYSLPRSLGGSTGCGRKSTRFCWTTLTPTPHWFSMPNLDPHSHSTLWLHTPHALTHPIPTPNSSYSSHRMNWLVILSYVASSYRISKLVYFLSQQKDIDPYPFWPHTHSIPIPTPYSFHTHSNSMLSQLLILTPHSLSAADQELFSHNPILPGFSFYAWPQRILRWLLNSLL